MVKFMDDLRFKKICGIGSMAVLSVAIILTAFVFGRDNGQIKTQSTPTTTAKTTTTSAVSTTATSQNADATTTQNNEEISTTTTQTATTSSEQSQTTTVTTTQKATQQTSATTTTTKATTTTTAKPTTTTTTTAKKPQVQNGKLDITSSVSNSWEENGKVCTQIDIFITNNTGSPINTFDVVINLGQSFEIVNSWNADFSVEGANLRASKTLDYNIENGSQFNAGLIVKADKKISL